VPSLKDLMALRSLAGEFSRASGDPGAAGALMRVAADELDRAGGIAGVTTLLGELMNDAAPAPPARPPIAAGPAPLTGAPLIGGIAEGIARIVATEANAAALAPGEIIVCAALSPSWSGAIERAAGIVTEAGAAAARPLQAARELGIPAVRLAAATKALAGAPRVRVLGEAGAVELLGPSSP
jgi:phosphohistidine swiveling domain-containing protein